MSAAVIVGAVRTPVGKRGGALTAASGDHSAVLKHIVTPVIHWS